MKTFLQTHLYILLIITSPCVVIAQESNPISLKTELNLGWNIFNHSGIDKDLANVRNTGIFSHIDKHVGDFGKGINLAGSIVTPVCSVYDLGIGIQYYTTKGFYSQNNIYYSSGHYDSRELTSEIDYEYSRISPQIIIQYSHSLFSNCPINIYARFTVGPSIVKFKKQFIIPFLISNGTKLPEVVPTLTFTGEYHSVIPEAGLKTMIGFTVLTGVNLKFGGGYSVAYSKEIAATYDENGLFYSFVKDYYLRDIALDYTGFTFEGGFEIVF